VSLVLLGATLLLGGCSKSRGTITGKVTYQNQPLASGSVVVVGADGIPRTAAISPDGSYSFANVACEEVRVAVHCPDPAGMEIMAHEEMKKRQPGVPPPPPRQSSRIDPDKWMPIPEHYGDFNKSGLKFTVQPGANTYNIDLQ
jgi:hypothetical protein